MIGITVRGIPKMKAALAGIVPTLRGRAPLELMWVKGQRDGR